jgi:hypothetical protein
MTTGAGGDDVKGAFRPSGADRWGVVTQFYASVRGLPLRLGELQILSRRLLEFLMEPLMLGRRRVPVDLFVIVKLSP